MNKALAILALLFSTFAAAQKMPDEVPPIAVHSDRTPPPMGCVDGYILWLNTLQPDGSAQFSQAEDNQYQPRYNGKDPILSCWKSGVSPK